MKRAVLAIILAGGLLLSAGVVALGGENGSGSNDIAGGRGGLCPPKEICPWIGAVDGGAGAIASGRGGISGEVRADILPGGKGGMSGEFRSGAIAGGRGGMSGDLGSGAIAGGRGGISGDV